MPKVKGLTLKQKRWKAEYLKTGNATEAAARAYDVKNRSVAREIGSENLAKPYLRLATEEEFKKENVTIPWVLKRLVHLAETAEPAIKTKNLELIGKYLQMFTEVRLNKTQDDLSKLTPEERREAINSLLDELTERKEGGESNGA